MAKTKAKIARSRGVRDSGRLIITDHAIARRVQYKGLLPGIESELKEVFEYGREVKPRDGLSKIIAHGFKNARYFVFRKKVIVVVAMKVVTTYAHKEAAWVYVD